jgi:hypothetical protein
MAYDAAKAHEYYMKYRKKGLKKSRKKSTKKKASTKTTSLVGLSSSGLNDAGKMQAALIKENIKAEMNAAIAKAKTPAERNAIRQEYQNKALTEIGKLKNDPRYAQAKSSGKSSGKTGGKSSGSKASSGKVSAASSKTTTKIDTAKQKAIAAATQEAETQIKAMLDKIRTMSSEEKQDAKFKIQDALNQIQQIQGMLARKKRQING